MRERREYSVLGLVQGVGFRPFVHRLATKLALVGDVRNAAGRVEINVEGEPDQLDAFGRALRDEAPPASRVEHVSQRIASPTDARDFRIRESDDDASADVFVLPDLATCDDCRRELFDPADRRFGYAFSSCTYCGPRLTIVDDVPYDRARTAMARFEMCGACRREYEDVGDRRFHAEPIACAECGPRLTLRDRAWAEVASRDPIFDAATRLFAGEIGAIKGLGGYHLACVATSDTAVATLRARKHRDDKPFAVMVADVAAAAAQCHVSPAEEALLVSSRAPIVLLRRKEGSTFAPRVAPGNPNVGVVLAYTPLHHALLAACGRTPLVMTSGNLSDEPIAHDDEDAASRLAELCDFFLVHDRPIRVRCDDSVTRVVAGAELPIRRSRGYAPQPITLRSRAAAPILAAGPQLKATFALARGPYAFISHHIGDLDELATVRAYATAIQHYERMLRLRPELIVHDLHPDYASTRYALTRAHEQGLPVIGVQHHHAHVASCLADNEHDGPVLGVAFDGTGYGHDGAIWGGELLLGDARAVQRFAHLRYVGMPGGDRAIVEPRRMAIAYLLDSGLDPAVIWPDLGREGELLAQVARRPSLSPLTSSVGRLYDAVAAILGVRERVTFEGQAAMELEWLAASAANEELPAYPFDLERDASGTWVLDMRRCIRAIVAERAHREHASISLRFHLTIVEAIRAVVAEARREHGIDATALSGGVFANALLLERAVRTLSLDGVTVLRHRRVCPNDGGIALGQLAVAMAQGS